MELIERQAALDALADALARARAGSGRVALIGAEAGGGKSALVDRFLAGMPGGVLVRRGWCDALSTPRPLGPFLDMGAAQLRESVASGASRSEILGAVHELTGADGPVVMVIEDVHWADEATLDAIRFLARRIVPTRTLLVLTYRDDEVVAGHPTQVLLGELVTNRASRRIELAPLSLAGVAALLDGSALDAREVLAITAGNPFYASELRDAAGDRVPRGVSDAVLARVTRLPSPARAALEAGAVVGPRAEQAVIDAISDVGSAAIDDGVRAGLITSSLGQVAFRHEIARQAIEEAILPARRRELHRRALSALEHHPLPVAVTRLVRHAEEAGDDGALLRHAARAGDEAASAGAHREAAAQYARALRGGPAEPAARAELWRRRSYECYLTGEIAVALDAMQQAIAIHRSLGDRLQIGSGLRWVGRLEWFLAHQDRADAAIAEAIAILEGEDDHTELAWAYSSRSQLAMLEFDAPAAISFGRRAIELVGPDGSAELRAHALNNIGTARVGAGDMGGLDDMREALALGLEHGYDEHVARLYCNAVSSALQQRRLADAESWLSDALDYCEGRDLDAWLMYLIGWQARLQLERGELDAAAATATAAIAHPRSTPVACVTPLAVLGLVRARRGDPGADESVERALGIALESGELQRLCPAAAAAAEIAWLAAAPPPLELLRDVLALAIARGDAWAIGELATWLRRLGDPVDVAADAAPPFAASLAGAPVDAAAWWHGTGAPYDEALALADAGDEPSLVRAVTLLDRVGAGCAAVAVRRLLRQMGGAVPAAPRRSTRANPAGLTRRELEVLDVLRTGASDADIAERLTISTRTASHHVSSILRKLGVPSRARAAAAAEALLESREPAARR